MIRKIIKIDEEKCNGCGLCASACHEGAIDIIDGKARLVRENFCDGFGDCLPNCPTGAITFEEREAPAYDEAAVKAAQQEGKNKTGEKIMQTTDETKRKAAMTKHLTAGADHPAGAGHPAGADHSVGADHSAGADHPAGADQPAGAGHPAGADQPAGADHSVGADHPAGGCPGSRLKLFERKEAVRSETAVPGYHPVSRLNQWPCQIKLLPTKAGFFNGAKLLIAADCTAYAYANMHEDFMKGRITVIGCPKLDAVDYTEKLTAIIRDNDIKGVTIVRMEVPCCGGLQRAAENALKASGKFIPWQVVTISTDGRILD